YLPRDRYTTGVRLRIIDILKEELGGTNVDLETVQGVPRRAAPGTLSGKELKLRAKLRSGIQHGPQRLIPLPG
ncbi:hypothetical protein AB0G81_28610, partial [Streptomyces asoensis]